MPTPGQIRAATVTMLAVGARIVTVDDTDPVASRIIQETAENTGHKLRPISGGITRLDSTDEAHVATALVFLDRLGFEITPRAGQVAVGHRDTWESVILKMHGGQADVHGTDDHA